MKNYGKMQVIRVGTTRIIPTDQTLGIHAMPAFNLKTGETFQILDKDIYGRYLVKLHGQKFWMWAKIIDQISNEL